MKKLLLIAITIFGMTSMMNAQVLSQGNIFIETNTFFGAASPSYTGFNFQSTDDFTNWSVGAEGGYFVMDNLAAKAGLGFSSFKFDDLDAETAFNWKIGGKYYIKSMFPIGIDLNGQSYTERGFNNEEVDINEVFLGFQAGYAWFISEKVSIEPGLRFDIPVSDDAGEDNFFGINIGFVIFL